MENKNLTCYLNELKNQGMTIIRSAISKKLIEQIRLNVIRDREYLESNYREALYRISSTLASPAHLGFMLPLIQPYCDDDVLSSTLLHDLLENYLGKGFYLHEYVCNVALANSDTKQFPHPDQEINPKGPVGVVCNLALEKTDASNGMTNIWSATHQSIINLTTDIYSFTCIQPELQPGDILIRDISLIHQGVGNPSNMDRYLLALVFKPEWEAIEDYAISSVSNSLLKKCSQKTKEVLRFHKQSSKKILPRAYPAPKEKFLGGY